MSKIPQEAIEALYAAIEKRSWLAVQVAANAIRDNSPVLPVATRAQGAEVEPVAWAYEYHDFGSVWARHVILNRPGGGANPPTKHHGSAVRNVEPLYTIAVRPLEWEVFCGNSGNSKAKAFFGEYIIQSEKVNDLPDWRIYLPNNDHNTGIKYATIEEAKAAAQADYEQRIRSALTTPPAPQPTDREKVLEDALQPFAKLAKVYDPDEGDDEDKCWVHEYTPTLGDLRRARAALAGEAPSQTDRAELGE